MSGFVEDVLPFAFMVLITGAMLFGGISACCEQHTTSQRLAAEYQYSIEATSTKGGYDYNGAELLVRKRLDAAMGLNNYIIHDERYNGKFYYSCHETNKYTAAGCKICQREADRLRRIQDEQRYK